MNKKRLNFCLLLATILMLIGCQKKKEKKQTLRISIFEETFKTFHPHLTADFNSTTICKALYEGLTRVNLKGKVELAIAKEIKISADKKKYFILLKDTIWSNNEKLTSFHFVNAWKKAFTLDSKCIRLELLFPIKNARKIVMKKLPLESLGIKALSKNQITIELEHPTPYFLELLADPILSPLYDYNTEIPKVFNGPFLIEKKAKNKVLILKKNLLYFDAENVNLSKIKLLNVSDQLTSFHMFEKNIIDWVGSPFCELPEDLINKSKLNLKTALGCAPFWLYCNTENSKLKSYKIRHALSLCIERDQIVKYILPYQVPCFTMFPRELYQIDKKEKFAKINLNEVKQLFLEGLKESNLDPKEFSLTLSHSNILRHEKLAHFLKQNWEKALGVKIILKKSDWKTFYSNIRSKNYELGGYCSIATFLDPTYYLNRFKKSKTNFSSWQNSKFQEYMELAEKEISLTKRNSYLKSAESILLKNSPIIPIYNQCHIYLKSDKLINLTPSKLAYIDFKWAYFDE